MNTLASPLISRAGVLPLRNSSGAVGGSGSESNSFSSDCV